MYNVIMQFILNCINYICYCIFIDSV